MKKFTTLLILLITLTCFSNLFAQAPEGIIYQAEARNNKDHLLRNKNLQVLISILENDASGPIVWEGEHTVTTNNYGIFTLIIGHGSNTTGLVFANIDWGNHPHFLNVQVQDPWKGKWVDMGTSQLLSVPYALHSKTAAEAFTADYNKLYNKPTVITNEADPVFSAWDKSTGIAISESQINDLQNYLTSETDPVFSAWDKSSGIVVNENQISDLQHFTNNDEIDPVFAAWDKNYNDLTNQPTNLSNFTNDEGFITSPADADADPTNEIQDLQLTGNMLTITKKGTATQIDLTPYLDDTRLTEAEVLAMVEGDGYQKSASDGDTDDQNELQDISLVGHELTISKGSTVTLPDEVDDADADPTNELNTSVTLNGTYLDVTDAGGTKSTDLSLLTVSWGNLVDVPEGFADGTDNIGSSAGDLATVLAGGNDGGTLQIKNIADPTDTQDAVTKAYVDILLEEINSLKERVSALEGNGGQSGVFLDERDGEGYNWAKIGDQIWFTENLRFEVVDQDYIYWAYTNDSANTLIEKYGRWYTWGDAVNHTGGSTLNPSQLQGICPDGWHLPSNAEWEQLIDFLATEGYSNTEGNVLKSTDGWYNNGNGTDNYGFTALPGGYWDPGHKYPGKVGLWWSATDAQGPGAWSYKMSYNTNSIEKIGSASDFYLNIRCVKD